MRVQPGASFWSRREGGLAIRLRLQPGASKDEIGGALRLADGAEVLAVKVRAVPERGRANEAACRLIAGALGLSGSRVTLTSGRKDRIKVLHVRGEPAELLDPVRGLGQAQQQ